MKTKIEINGYEITIEEVEGVITILAEKDGDVIEEITLKSEDDETEEDSDDVKSFDDFEKDSKSEEDDNEMEEDEESDLESDDDDNDTKEENELKTESLLSFDKFLKRK